MVLMGILATDTSNRGAKLTDIVSTEGSSDRTNFLLTGLQYTRFNEAKRLIYS